MDNFENIQTNQEYNNENFTYIPSNKNLSDYSFNFNKNVEIKDIKTNIFKDIIGYDNQKEELSYVIRWFKSSKELKKKGVTFPKSVLLFGKPGNGKSFFIKEIIKNCNFPTFIFKGEGKEMADIIYEIFRIARKYSQSIIVFDELDLLINKQERVMRAQQECLDGVESFDDILVLAATNDLYEILDALIRHGRLEKFISIPYPMEEEAYEMLEYYFQKFNIKLSDNIDKDKISSLLIRFTCAAIKSIANETVLKNGFENITTEMIEDSIYSASDRIKDSPRENNFEVVVHEAGHGAVAYSFPDFFIVNRMNINPLGGFFMQKRLMQDIYHITK